MELNFHHGVPVELGSATSVFSIFALVLLARLLPSGVVQHEEDKPRDRRFLLATQTTREAAVQISAIKSKSLRL